jgi:hypothetical protein
LSPISQSKVDDTVSEAPAICQAKEIRTRDAVDAEVLVEPGDNKKLKKKKKTSWFRLGAWTAWRTRKQEIPEPDIVQELRNHCRDHKALIESRGFDGFVTSTVANLVVDVKSEAEKCTDYVESWFDSDPSDIPADVADTAVDASLMLEEEPAWCGLKTIPAESLQVAEVPTTSAEHAVRKKQSESTNALFLALMRGNNDQAEAFWREHPESATKDL